MWPCLISFFKCLNFYKVEGYFGEVTYVGVANGRDFVWEGFDVECANCMGGVRYVGCLFSR